MFWPEMQGICILAWLMDYRRGREEERKEGGERGREGWREAGSEGGREGGTEEEGWKEIFGGKYSICQIQIT